MSKRLCGLGLLALAALAVSAAPAAAQYGARRPDSSGGAVGETYHVEFSGGFWNPTPNILVSSEQFGIIGSQIDGVADLGFQKSKFSGFSVILRPATKHKFRAQYTPIQYSAETIFRRPIVFNGIRYDVGIPVSSELKWHVWRLGYEWDFVRTDRGFAGLLVDVKFIDTEVKLESLVANEFVRVQAPIPGIGGIGRYYFIPNVAASFELSWLHVGEIDGHSATYIDWDLYGTVNFTENVGAQVGYRSMDVNYTIERDFGDLVLRGLYFNGVVRF